MGIMDKVKGAVAKNSGKAGRAIDKAADAADGRTGRKHTGKINSAADKARNYVNKMDRGQADRPNPES